MTHPYNLILTTLLLSATALAGCTSHRKPPEISYDNAAPAVESFDPPSPVEVVELSKPLHSPVN